MADHTAGYAAFTIISENFRILTIEFKINFLKPAYGNALKCRSKVINRGKELSSLRSQLEYWNDGIMGEGGQDHKVKEEKRDNCLLAKLLLTGELINEKLLLKPTFHYSTIPLFQVQGKDSNPKKFL